MKFYYITCEDQVRSSLEYLEDISCECGNDYERLGWYSDEVNVEEVYRSMQQDNELEINTYDEFIYFFIEKLDRIQEKIELAKLS